MAEFSDYMENAIINIMRGVTFTGITAYIALFTTATADDGSGVEVSGGSYARQPAGLSAASGGESSNSAEVTFPTATADWGTVTNIALMDAVTDGEMLMHSPLDVSKVIANGDTFKINALDLHVTID